jgi:TPR repeat protein
LYIPKYISFYIDNLYNIKYLQLLDLWNGVVVMKKYLLSLYNYSSIMVLVAVVCSADLACAGGSSKEDKAQKAPKGQKRERSPSANPFKDTEVIFDNPLQNREPEVNKPTSLSDFPGVVALAKLGDRDALYTLGTMYEEERFQCLTREEQLEFANRYYNLSAKAGNPFAKVKILEQRVNGGDKDALTELGNSYHNIFSYYYYTLIGLYDDERKQKAFEYLKKSADADNPISEYEYYLVVVNGDAGILEPERSKVATHYLTKAAKQGYLPAQAVTEYFQYESRNIEPETALGNLRLLSNKGCLEATLYLENIYKSEGMKKHKSSHDGTDEDK